MIQTLKNIFLNKKDSLKKISYLVVSNLSYIQKTFFWRSLFNEKIYLVWRYFDCIKEAKIEEVYFLKTGEIKVSLVSKTNSNETLSLSNEEDRERICLDEETAKEVIKKHYDKKIVDATNQIISK